MRFLIRIAEEKDAAMMLEIYAPFIVHTAISFEYEVPSPEEFSLRIQKYLHDYPWIVCEYNDRVIGYAYAGKHRDRTAYQWSVESSVYVQEGFHRKGIAKILYETLFELLRHQGILNAYAGIALPNDKSVHFHHAFGFHDVGIYKKIGYKLGAWHDVLWMSLPLGEYPEFPDKPLTFQEFRTTPACREILENATSSINR